MSEAPKKFNSAAVLCLACGIFSGLSAYVMCVNILSLPVAIFGVLFGIAGLFIAIERRGVGLLPAASGIVLCVLFGAIGYSQTGSWLGVSDQAGSPPAERRAADQP